jgi:putative iron-regulated protein
VGAVLVTGVASFVAACGDDDDNGNEGGTDPNDLAGLTQVLETNADIAVAMYNDSITTAEDLQAAIQTFVNDPTEANLDAAREAWRIAQEPYSLTEVYRFRDSPIDLNPANGEEGPEGELNAWPLGEGLIDYVVTGDDFGDAEVNVTVHGTGVQGPIPENNIVNSEIGLDDALLEANVTAEDERDVITGYHAIEFMLWGQDVTQNLSADAPRDASPGQRPATDYMQNDLCTTGTPSQAADQRLCGRRAQYLTLIAQKLIDDLTQVRDGWVAGSSYRDAFVNPANLAAAKQGLLEIITGMTTLARGELAGERMQIALTNNSQEDEHSCFSDNTHRDIVLNAEGVRMLYEGVYPGYDSDLDGIVDATANAVNGTGIDDYLRDVGLNSLAADVETSLVATQAAYQAIDALARQTPPVPVDLQIVAFPGADSMPMQDTIRALFDQSVEFVRIAEELDIGSEADVFQDDSTGCDTSDPTAQC